LSDHLIYAKLSLTTSELWVPDILTIQQLCQFGPVWQNILFLFETDTCAIENWVFVVKKHPHRWKRLLKLQHMQIPCVVVLQHRRRMAELIFSAPQQPSTTEPQPSRRSFRREYLHHPCLSPSCRIGQISCHRRLYPLLCHRGRWDFCTGTPNLEGRTRSSIAVARAYNNAELGDVAWEHEPPSSFREATARSLGARASVILSWGDDALVSAVAGDFCAKCASHTWQTDIVRALIRLIRVVSKIKIRLWNGFCH
jgi:hypothetical protein